jgi:tetratricopeptide (TPR) repeat protein
MNFELNPRLLDFVEFEDASEGGHVKRKGTIVETFGEPPNAVLIEVTDSQGIPLSYFNSKSEDVKRIWAAAAPAEESTPAEAQQYFEKGILFLQNGLIARAKEQFSRAFSLDENLRAALLNATIVLAQKDKLDTAIRVYELILELQPQYELAWQNLSAAHVQRGIKLGRAGLLDQAIEAFNLAMMLRPRPESIGVIRHNLVAAHTQVAIRYSDCEQYREAVSYFLIAFGLDPSDATQRNLGIALVASAAANIEAESRLPDAEFFSEAIQLGLTFSECLNAYGATLARHGRISEATRALERAVEADAKNELAKKNLDSILRHPIPGTLVAGLLPIATQELAGVAA